ncbi:ABC transporter permease [Candidatus Dependentiae bacterium]|nr:ABC transporter permease [Candidatus Dependentiae bacterium]
MNNVKTIIWHTVICLMRNYIYIGFFSAALILIGFAFICANVTGLFQERVFIDSSMFFIELISVITAVFISSTTIIKDIQSKEVYYILSRPISKNQYVIGRYLGVSICVLFMHLIITFLFVVISLIFHLELSNIMKLNFFVVSSLKILLICSISLIFSTYSTSFFPAIMLSFVSIITFEFLESLKYWLTFNQPNVILQSIYKVLFFVMPNFIYYDIFFMFDMHKFSSLSRYVFSLSLYTFFYAAAFLIISLISFNKRSI